MVATVNAMKLKFPEFQTVADAAVAFALEEAALFLGSWTSTGGARDVAWMYLTAHLISVANAGADSDGREITHESIGRISTTYKSTAGGIGIGDLESTMYGARYMQLKNLGNPRFKVI